ncbi:MAG: hypothetical protein ACP5NW_02915, partial [Candidatus Woesearchaeota archaeon]
MVDDVDSGRRSVESRNDKLVLVGTLLLMMSLLLITFGPQFTGLFTFDDGVIESVVILNKTYDSSAIESISVDGVIRGVSVTGRYSGNFKLWMDIDGERLLVADSSRSSGSLDLITGLDVLDVNLASEEEIVLPEESNTQEQELILEVPVLEENVEDISDMVHTEESDYILDSADSVSTETPVQDIGELPLDGELSIENISEAVESEIFASEEIEAVVETAILSGDDSSVLDELVPENISVSETTGDVTEIISDNVTGEIIA